MKPAFTGPLNPTTLPSKAGSREREDIGQRKPPRGSGPAFRCCQIAVRDHACAKDVPLHATNIANIFLERETDRLNS
jgi:hypothetical protein